MFTLGDIKIKLSFALGTAETNLMTNEKRTDAINRAIQIILEQYPIPQYIKSTDLTFVAGVSNLPTDCTQPLKVTDANSAFVEYKRVTWDDFTLQINQSFTISWDYVNNVEIIKTFPTNLTLLTFWYVQNQPALASDADTVRFNIWWLDAIAEKAAEQLLTSSAAFNRAEAKNQVATTLLAKAWQLERLRIVGPENNRLKSIYSTKASLLRGSSNIYTTNA